MCRSFTYIGTFHAFFTLSCVIISQKIKSSTCSTSIALCVCPVILPFFYRLCCCCKYSRKINIKNLISGKKCTTTVCKRTSGSAPLVTPLAGLLSFLLLLALLSKGSLFGYVNWEKMSFSKAELSWGKEGGEDGIQEWGNELNAASSGLAEAEEKLCQHVSNEASTQMMQELLKETKKKRRTSKEEEPISFRNRIICILRARKLSASLLALFFSS